MSLAANIFRAIAVSVTAAAKLRATGSEVDLHLAVRHEVLAEELLQKALDEDLDAELIKEDLAAGEEPETLEQRGDPEMLEELENIHCVDCLPVAPGPQGIPSMPGGPSAVPTTLSGGIVAREGTEEDEPATDAPRRKAEKRKYLACSQPKLARARGGKKVWMSICAYQVPPSKKTRMIAKIVSRNSTFKPRYLAEGGRKVPFVTDADIDQMASRE